MKHVLIIGFGSMGKLYCDMILHSRIAEIELVGIVTHSPAKIDVIHADYPDVACFTDFDDALKSGADSIIITTPHPTHLLYAEKAIAAGLSVLCEKPICVSCHGVEKIENLIEHHEDRFQIIFNWRMRPVYQKLKELVASNQLGKITHVIWIANNWYRTKFYHEQSVWRSSWSGEGGGLAINQMQHVFDIWCWLFGRPNQIRSHVDFGKFNNFDVDDSFEVLFFYDSGLTGVCISATGESPGSNHLEIHGEYGKIIMEDNHISIYLNKESSVKFSREAKVTTGIPYAKEEFDMPDIGLEEYVKVLTSFSNPESVPRWCIARINDGFNTVNIANSIYLSSWKNEIIKLPFDYNEYEKAFEKKKKQELW